MQGWLNILRAAALCAAVLCVPQLRALADEASKSSDPLATLRAQLSAARESIKEARKAQQELFRRLDALQMPEPEPVLSAREQRLVEEGRHHWSFQPLLRLEPPRIGDETAAINPIDRFVVAKLAENGLKPNSRAAPRSLLRRLYFDLTGLPPAPEQVEAFEQDSSKEAYERIVDELLASPRFGERWARHWLDVARYADSDGYEFDIERPHAYPYRDFVIRAFNEDLPFNTFVQWQIAGDEIAPDNPMAVAATGFCTNGPTISNQQNELNRYDELDDILSTTGTAVLGMTLGCARCHDHKYDPVPMRDYYRMLSAFATTKRHDALLGTREEIAAYRARYAEWEARLKVAKDQLDSVYGPVRGSLRALKIEALQISEAEKELLRAPVSADNAEQKLLLEKYMDRIAVGDDELNKSLDSESAARADAIRERIDSIELEKPQSPPVALALTDSAPTPADNYFLARGDPFAKRDKVPLGFLSVLPGSSSDRFKLTKIRPESATTTYQRTALARWLTDVDEGAGRLTARVVVNRLWHHHFGQGIVRTTSDFGTQGDPPSHPELLDWLATELIRHGWSLKSIHKLMVMSDAYQRSSAFDPDGAARDPDNRLLWRRAPQRLEAEIIRDATLAVTACLNLRMYGPGVFPYMPPDAIATGSTAKWPKDARDGPDTWRRSVYVFVRRSARMPMIEAFDAPDTVIGCGRRLSTVTPTQALSLMNSEFISDQARYFAERILRETGSAPVSWVGHAYALALSRPPSEREIELATNFILLQTQRHERHEAAKARGDIYYIREEDPRYSALTDFCQVVLSLNEFVYID